MAELVLLCEQAVLCETTLFQGLWSWATLLGVRVSIYQPQYFPRLHYFARALNSDIFAIADYLQYVRRHIYPTSQSGVSTNGPSYQAHTPVKIGSGPYLLSVPVRHQSKDGIERLNETRLDYTKRWVDDHLQTIELHYKKAPYFVSVFPSLDRVLRTSHASLSDLTISSFLWGFGVLWESKQTENITLDTVNDLLQNSDVRLKKISVLSATDTLPADKTQGDDPNDWLIKTTRYFGADEYYFGGSAAAAYMDFTKFKNAGINLVEQEWSCSEYPQRFPKAGFAKNLSIIDLLMNVSPSEARRILQAKDS